MRRIQLRGATMLSGRSCATCAWWTRKGPRLASASRNPAAAESTGTCQAHAPVVAQVLGGGRPLPVSVFPETHESRFCGEWRAIGGGGDDGERVLPFSPPARRAAA